MEIELIGIIGENYVAICECSGNEEDLIITETGLLCPLCKTEQPHYTDEDDWSVVEYGLFGDC